ncbi:uncharacterized protein BX664DRAFT_359148 [Halteromyces radiatus]|uniref:uncharacterized protein n=1 Tax=Halteromyces radiatus TaxID=101107 RepID=UPI0022200132|nr:uncharacterized protein BX664DRAFT_359148 [Halteromyces radiatus]KAI8089610.1 hypothetical protein BX664DRAFT_359148 [Halteromyces radiatus]
MGHHHESFWRYLVQSKYRLSYHHPFLSWYQLAISRHVDLICPHLNGRLHDPWKQDIDQLIAHLSTLLCHQYTQSTQIGNQASFDLQYRTPILCCPSSSSSSSSFSFGCGDIFFEPQKNPGHLYGHYQKTGHSIILKVSSTHFIEMWCYACNRPLGYWGSSESEYTSASEKYIVKQWIQRLTWSLDMVDRHHGQMVPHLVRRQWELRLLLSKTQSPCYLLDSQWFYAWINYLSSPSMDPPSSMPQHDYFLINDHPPSIHPHLKLNQHFVLVSSQLYFYIQRIYGIQGPTIHKDQLYQRQEYKELLQQIDECIDHHLTT